MTTEEEQGYDFQKLNSLRVIMKYLLCLFLSVFCFSPIVKASDTFPAPDNLPFNAINKYTYIGHEYEDLRLYIASNYDESAFEKNPNPSQKQRLMEKYRDQPAIFEPLREDGFAELILNLIGMTSDNFLDTISPEKREKIETLYQDPTAVRLQGKRNQLLRSLSEYNAFRYKLVKWQIDDLDNQIKIRLESLLYDRAYIKD